MADVKPYPVNITGDLSSPPSRWQWIFKWLLLIPHYIVLYFLGIAAFVVTVIAFFSILFTGKYPKSLFDFVVGYFRWSWRVSFYGYNVLGTDKYPPFTLDKAAFPADLDISYPDRLKNLMVLVKWLLAVPHYIILYILQIVLEVLIVVVAVVLLFTGKYLEEIFKFVVGINRWQQRVMAYVLLMTDEYPPFSFD